jgi:hypothetical protein
LLDHAAFEDQYHQHQRIAQRDEFQVLEPAFSGTGRRGQRGFVRAVRQHGYC